MPHTTTLLVARQSFHYVAGWAHLDDWEEVAHARQTQPVLSFMGAYGETQEYVSQLVLSPQEWLVAKRVYRRLCKTANPRRRPLVTFIDWLRLTIGDSFISGCQCEHDCCGHLQQSASAEYLGQRRFTVTLRRVRNC